jgi:hypothetical protein
MAISDDLLLYHNHESAASCCIATFSEVNDCFWILREFIDFFCAFPLLFYELYFPFVT